MPNIKFAKTSKEMYEITKKIEDRLIIKKDSDSKGRIFYDWDANNRLEIVSLQLAYYSKATMTPGSGNTINIAKSNIVNLTANPSSETASTNIIMNSLVYDGSNIGIIIGEDTSNVTIFVIYKPTPLQWNDYFEGNHSGAGH